MFSNYMVLNAVFKIQYFNNKTGYWITISEFGRDDIRISAQKELNKEYKLDNSRKYRLIKVTEELIDILYPPIS